MVQTSNENSDMVENARNLYEKRRTQTALSLVPRANDPACALDMGCGLGILAESITRRGYHYIGFDISTEQTKLAKSTNKSFDFLIADAHALPFRRGFGLAIALELIEHSDRPLSFLKQVSELLVDGGCLVISTPNRLSLEGLKGKIYAILSGKRWDAWGGRGHKRIFASSELVSILKIYFRIVRIVGYYYFPHIPWKEKLNDLCATGRPLRYATTSRKALNMLGFQTLVLCKNNG